MQTSFGIYLKELRQQQELSIRQLGTLSGVSHSFISQIEKGDRDPSPETIEKLQPFLGVRYEEIMIKAGYIKVDKIDNGSFSSNNCSPGIKKIIDSLSRADELNDHDFDDIAEQVEGLINYAKKQKKRNSLKGR